MKKFKNHNIRKENRMHWYEKLNQYFPIEEMKSKEHIENLIKERSDIYHIDESPKHILLYVELEHFIFINYLLVSKNTSGEGIGHKLLEKLKRTEKPLITLIRAISIGAASGVE